MQNTTQSSLLEVKLYLMDGAVMPSLGRPSDAGYDLATHRIVTKKMDAGIPYCRETLWDFTSNPDPSISKYVGVDGKGRPSYVLPHSEVVRISFGIVLCLTDEWYAVLAPRGSTTSRLIEVKDQIIGINVFNRLAPIDAGFRGEFFAIIENRSGEDYQISKGQAIAQLVFHNEAGAFRRPKFTLVTPDQFGLTDRGTASNGSSGTHRV